MKRSLFAPPALALVVSGVWLNFQQREITDLEHKTATLGSHIAAVESANTSSLPSASTSSNAPISNELPKSLLLENGALDWVGVAKFINASNRRGSSRDLRTMILLEQKLLALEVIDFQKTFRLIKRLQLSPQHRNALETTLGRIYIQKTPQTALRHFEQYLSDQKKPLFWMLRKAVGDWAKDDPAAALSWFNKQKTAGKFETKELNPNNGIETSYAAQIYSAMLLSDPAQVDAHLSILPEKQKEDLLRDSSLWIGDEEKDGAYFKLIRRNLKEEEQQEIIGTALVLPLLRGGNLSSISEKLSTAAISPAERQAGLEKVSQHFARPWNRTPDELKEAYAWFGQEEPARQIELTAKTYSRYANHRNTDFEATFKEVLNLAKEANKPEILTQFAARLERTKDQLNTLTEDSLKTTLTELLKNLPD